MATSGGAPGMVIKWCFSRWSLDRHGTDGNKKVFVLMLRGRGDNESTGRDIFGNWKTISLNNSFKTSPA